MDKKSKHIDIPEQCTYIIQKLKCNSAFIFTAFELLKCATAQAISFLERSSYHTLHKD